MNVIVQRIMPRFLRGATAVLILTAILLNSMLCAYATQSSEETAENDAGYSFTINGDTVFSVTNAEPYVAASGGSGHVEIATNEGAVIWANLGGAGSGVLTESMITGLDATDHTLSGNTLTIAGYPITVRDNSASGTPLADGSTKTYDFRDGSVVSTLYASNSLTDGAYVSSSDKLLTLTGNNSISYNGSQHGIHISQSDTVSVKVAGNATIVFSLCLYGNTGTINISAENNDGTLSLSSFDTMAASDGGTQTVDYTGDSTTITFTWASGSSYLHSISVTNEAEETQVTGQEAMPSISGNGLTVTPTGQRLTLSQSGGSLATNSALSDTVGYYLFPAAADGDMLEADITVTACGNSSSYGVFLGACDLSAQRIAIAGIRNSTNLRCVYSNPNSNYDLGAGGVNETISAGQTVHIKVTKDGSDLSVELTPKGGTTYTAKLPYSGTDENCQLGLALANAAATVTNMVYKTEDGTVLYDQNDCYAPIGQAPVVTSVAAAAAGTREAIVVSWQISTPASGDGYYLVEAMHDGGLWTEIARTTETSYTYPISEGGSYQFRVSGGLGENGQGTEPVTSEPIDILRALPTPVLTAVAGADSVTLSWDAVDGATSYDIYRSSYNAAVQQIYTASGDMTSYTDASVEAEVPYYYYVTALSADNWSNPSATVWAMPTAGHTGTYLPVEEGAHFTLTQGTAETVFSDALTLSGTADRAGVVRAYLNGVQAGADQSIAANGSFSYDLTLAQGSNTVTLILTDADGSWSRAVYNYYYLPMNSQSIGKIVDAAYTGVDGVQDENGIPTYRTVQAAVDSVSTDNASEIVIFVRAGDYEERLVVNTPNITLIGEGENTLIHCYPAELYPNDSGYEAGGDMSKRCATHIQSAAVNFHAENISFANDYVYGTADNKSNKSADALRCDADGASFVNVTISGVQDTLYLDRGVQTFTNCRIEGLIDFIYSGNDAKVLFNDCEIVFVYEETHSASGIVCAPRTAADADCGLVFYRCSVTAETGCSGDAFRLARPWGPDAAVYWIDCYMSGIVNKDVPYQDMSGNSYQAARFYECGSYGPGYAINEVRRQISPAQATDLLSVFGISSSAPLQGAPVGSEPPADTTAPTLTAGTAERISATSAVVKFTSDESGNFYYTVVETGATEGTTVSTDGVGTSCTSGENTISLDNISGDGAKDIYIVVKDAAGNASTSLSIQIPAYVQPTYGIAADPSLLNFGSETAGYVTVPAAQTVTISNTGNQTLTLVQPTAVNYSIGALSTSELAAGATAVFTVQPNAGLAVGIYNETLTISGSNNATTSVELSFAVTETTHVHEYSADWKYDDTTHWHECSCGEKAQAADHVYIDAQDATCDVCGYERNITPVTYTLTVDLNGGSGDTADGKYAGGTVINITAGTRANYRFTGWTSSNGGSFADASSASTTFTMPDADTTITANWAYSGSGSGSGSTGGGSTGGGSSSGNTAVSTPSTSGGTTTVTTTASPTVSGSTASATVSSGSLNQAVNDVLEEAADQDTAPVVEIAVDVPSRADSVAVTLPTASLEDLGEHEDAALMINTDVAVVTLDDTAIASVAEQAGSQLTITVTPVETESLSASQQEAVGSAPVYDISITSGGKYITSFDGGVITVSLPYELASGQDPEGIVVYYLDGQGNLTPCETAYNVRTGMVTFTITHLSKYVIAYVAPWANPFSDVDEGSWYYNAVAYANTNGLMHGYSASQFAPDGGLTRAQLVQILYSLEGRPDLSDEILGYPYSDVTGDVWYTNAVYWARISGVAGGYPDGSFGPNAPITREQLAVMLYRYAQYKGCSVSVGENTNILSYTDVDQLSEYAMEAMQWACGAGIISGTGAGALSPQAGATRAQTAVMLMQLCEKVLSAG